MDGFECRGSISLPVIAFMQQQYGISWEQTAIFDAANDIDFAKEVMNDMKTMGSWDSYLSYDKWIRAS